MAYISRSIKLLAKELDIAIIVLSQLNKDHLKSASKTPELSNLRESDALGSDCTIAIFIKNEDTGQKKLQ